MRFKWTIKTNVRCLTVRGARRFTLQKDKAMVLPWMGWNSYLGLAEYIYTKTFKTVKSLIGLRILGIIRLYRSEKIQGLYGHVWWHRTRCKPSHSSLLNRNGKIGRDRSIKIMNICHRSACLRVHLVTCPDFIAVCTRWHHVACRLLGSMRHLRHRLPSLSQDKAAKICHACATRITFHPMNGQSRRELDLTKARRFSMWRALVSQFPA